MSTPILQAEPRAVHLHLPHLMNSGNRLQCAELVPEEFSSLKMPLLIALGPFCDGMAPSSDLTTFWLEWTARDLLAYGWETPVRGWSCPRIRKTSKLSSAA